MTFNGTQLQSRRLRPLGVLALAAAALSGCLNRPVAQTRPETNNIFVKQNPAGGVDKIDVLFMIDNSLSMGDKQEVLAAAVPQLLRRLTNPDCVAQSDGTATRLEDPNAPCASGSQREFAPVKDIHIGIVSSSLGDFGGDTCPETGEAQYAAMNDKGWLMGALPRNQGKVPGEFLDWTPDNVRNYATAINDKVAEFGNFVKAVSEIGCGNEMILEGWYRFLVDTEPPLDIITENAAANKRTGVDEKLLALRKSFLRPDSLLAVFMLADENDCSMRDDDYGWVAMKALGGWRMWRGSSACASNPNDECCFSCMLGKKDFVSDKCLAADTACRQDGADVRLQVGVDDVNTRCRMMKKRFGRDFLFPPSRYVNALSMPEICPDQTYGDLDCDCKEAKAKGLGSSCQIGRRGKVRNPIYMNLDDKYVPTGPERIDSSSVFLAGVVGVPWQDLVKDRNAAVLQYMTAGELADDDRWSLFAPKVNEDYSTAQLRDPLMIESFEPRSGRHPITNEDLAGPNSGRMANSINGHEYNTANKDVQFACVFNLDVQLTAGKKALRTCVLDQECGADDASDQYKVCARRFDGCSCTNYPPVGEQKNPLDPNESHSPLCQAADGSYGNQQFYAKAYPGLRELQVLRGFYESGAGDNAIVGSICPKDLEYNNRESAGYGYNPAVKSLVDRLKDKLAGTCLPRKLERQDDGTVPCAIVEAIPPQIKTSKPEWCKCVDNGRDAVEGDLAGAIRGGLRNQGICDGADQSKCSDFCLCGLRQLVLGGNDDAAAQKCLSQVNVEKTTEKPGFCYVDPDQEANQDLKLGEQAVVAACKNSEKRIIRIVGNGNDTSFPYGAAPAPGRVFIACSGSAYEKPTVTPAP